MDEQKAIEVLQERKALIEKDYMKNDGVAEYYEAINTAIVALEKQVVVPLKQTEHPHFKCIGKVYDCKCGVAYLDTGSKYCGNCGQKLRKE